MVEGVWILGGIERTPEKKCFFEVLRFRNKESLNTLIKNNIKINTHVYTDMWKGYFDLGQIGYIHKTVNHSREFVNRENGVHTNAIEGIWAALKEFTPKRYRSQKYVVRYLNTYELRKNLKEEFYKLVILNCFNKKLLNFI
ncbi:putative transposase [Spraguea lophii 42_110]|uniref:Putative transposase n=1 Tax=Spraguea lophii (strain 42_110) TaxID=1358809 RepID=S7W8D3_SPRLO|nr:putative transposase [Spraguea lophii 42_110]